MHGGYQDEDEPMAEMNLIPLIDIALTLLIILMVTTVFVHRPGVNLNLPKTVTREGLPETDKDLTITVAASGDLYVDGKKTDDAAVQANLTARGKADKEARVLVKGDSHDLAGCGLDRVQVRALATGRSRQDDSESEESETTGHGASVESWAGARTVPGCGRGDGVRHLFR